MSDQPNWFRAGVLLAILTVSASVSYHYWIQARKTEADMRQAIRLQSCLDGAVASSVRLWDQNCTNLGRPEGCELPTEAAQANSSKLERDRQDCYRAYPVPGIPNR